MVNWKSRKVGDWLMFLNGLVIILLINILLDSFFFRIDLTQEKRYSVKDQTKKVLRELDDDVYVEVFLEGDLNAEFKRFQKSIAETLEEFRIYSGNKVKYSFTEPAQAQGQKAQAEFMNELGAKGIQPTNVIDNKNGNRAERIIYPGVLVSYGGAEKGVTLLKGSKTGSPAEEINQSIEGIEFELARTISNLVRTDRKKIGFVTGHGELDSLNLSSIRNDLAAEYEIHSTKLENVRSQKYQALVIAKPTTTFSRSDKFYLDQYIMNGGRILFLIDRVNASMDSASRDNYFALPYDLGLDDPLFKYGVRINMDLVQDKSASFYPVITGQTAAGKPKVTLLDWPFFPLVNHYADHPVTRNLDAVIIRFASSIDTVKAEGVKKTPLMMTSALSRTIAAPIKISANDLRNPVPEEEYTTGAIPLGYLLEGKFTSVYKNRPPEELSNEGFKDSSVPTRLIVISDGDIIRNDINFRTRQPRPLGFDPATNYTFANREFIMNALAYLTEEDGLIQVRNKQVMIRPLDKSLIRESQVRWQVINLLMPLVMIVIYGIARVYWRKKKFASF
ncbi:MAG: gliding motility-associated ABC transporter substrate-binding protein GldG [Chryseolinea sp.]